MYRLLLALLFLTLFRPMTGQGLPFPSTDAERGVLPAREIRAVWLTTLSGLDWPSRPATTTEGVARQQRELCAILDRLAGAGINVVMLQTRVRATTIYPSAIEPWDGALTGTPGRDPGYDPLAFAITEAHRRGMELHAWVVAFPVCTQAVARQLGTKSIVARRPDLCRRTGDRWMMDPGEPGTADYLARLCAEIVERYPVDGIHLDYIRYPESGIPWDDRATYRRYGGGRSTAAWRTDCVNRCVESVSRAVRAVRPWVKMSCSPVGKYADLPRQSSYGWNARDAVSQDAALWLQRGWMDWLFPMMYFDGKHFYPFAADWQERSAGRAVVPGLGIYFLSPGEKDWPLSTVTRQLHYIRRLGMSGYALYRSRFLTDNDAKGLLPYLRDFNARPALPPAMTWADSIAPSRPAVTTHTSADGALWLDWPAVPDATPVTYNVYRQLPDSTLQPVALRLERPGLRLRPALPALRHSRYIITAMDAYGNESEGAWTAPPVPLRSPLPPVNTTQP